MSESGDYDPGVWRGHDFSTARASYDRHVGRSYNEAVSSRKTNEQLLPAALSTNSTAPLIFIFDVTGSMGDWPATMFSKVPYMELEGQEYLGKNLEISFAAVGDAYTDRYPLQGRPFTKGLDLKKKLEELVIEGGGGGQTTESYELAALYYARNVSMPNAIKPILIFVGDEQPYDFVDKSQANGYVHIKLQQRLSTREIFEELKRKYAVYLIRKPYQITSVNTTSELDTLIHRAWAELLGDDHVAILPDAGRIVDVVFGILAKETNRIDYFRNEITGRQKPEQVQSAYRSLKTIHKSPANEQPKKGTPLGRSTMHGSSGGRNSTPLI